MNEQMIFFSLLLRLPLRFLFIFGKRKKRLRTGKMNAGS